MVEGIKEGDVVTFTFDNYSRGVIPVNPSVTRVRTDISWEQVLNDYANDFSKLSTTSGIHNLAISLIDCVSFLYCNDYLSLY
jgi:hypothetical protein